MPSWSSEGESWDEHASDYERPSELCGPTRAC